MNTNRRLLVIGLDGFEEHIAKQLIAEGRLPTLQRLFKDGAFVPVDHGDAKRSGLAWEHFATGLSPEGASRWSAVSFDPATYLCTQMPTQLVPFAQQLPVSTVVFDPPYFDLRRAPDVKGLVCWGAHDPGTSATANPEGLAAEIAAKFGSYPAESFIYGYTWASEMRTRQMAQAIVRATQLRGDIASWLFGERLPDWQLGVMVISEFHSAIEALWHGVDAEHPLHHLPSAAPARDGIIGVYLAVDAMLAQLTSQFADCSVLLFSLHGMGANDSDVSSMALLPEMMYRRHFHRPRLIAEAKDSTALPVVGEDESWSAHVRRQFEPVKPRLRDTVLEWWRRSSGSGVAEDTGGEGHPVSWMPASWYASFWSAMPVFALPSFYDGQLRLNVRGREAKGLIAPEDYDKICRQIGAELERCVNPRTGKSAVAKIIYTRPHAPFALQNTEADIVVLWRGSPLALALPDGDVIGPLAYRRPGGHSGGDGCAVWIGSDFLAGRYPRVSAFDVVPTLCQYLGQQIPRPCDGQSFIGDILKDAKG